MVYQNRECLVRTQSVEYLGFASQRLSLRDVDNAIFEVTGVASAAAGVNVLFRRQTRSGVAALSHCPPWALHPR